MNKSNSVDVPENGRTKKGARTTSIRLTGAWGITTAFAVLLGILSVASWTVRHQNIWDA
jgi:hypothetical protein